MKKLVLLFLNTLIFFAFSQEKKSFYKNDLCKHLLGNSVTGAIKTCATTALIAPLSLYCTSKITNTIIPKNPLSELSYKNYVDCGLFANLLIPFYTFKKYDSGFLIPSWIGFFIAYKFTCRKLAGI